MTTRSETCRQLEVDKPLRKFTSSELLRHATTQITADLYQHVIPGMGAVGDQPGQRLRMPLTRTFMSGEGGI